MNDNRKNNVKKTMGTINSPWMKNVLKSMGAAGASVIKDMAPATADTVLSGTRMATDMAKTITTSKTGNVKLTTALKSNPAVIATKEFLNNAIEDVKSGNIYNTDRSPFGEDDDFGMSFGDMDDMFGDEDSEINVQNNVINTDNGASIKAIKEQTEYQLQTAKATVDTMVSLTSASLMKSNEIGSKVISQLVSINSNLAALVEYNNTNMTKFIEASIGFYEQQAAAFAGSGNSDSGSSNRISAESIYSSSGGLDMNAYAQYVKQNIKDSKNNSMIGGALSMILENKGMFTSNPIGTIMTATMRAAVPSILKEASAALDETVKDFIPVMLDRIAHIADNDNSMYSGLSKTIADILGVKTNRKTSFDLTKFDKGPIPYNGVANHTIVEIIPKYLRESNSYLKEIAEAITGKNSNNMRRSSEAFDWQTGTFKSVNQMNDDIYGSIYNEVDSVFKRSKFGEYMMRGASHIKENADKDKWEDFLSQVFTNMEKHGESIDFKDIELLNSIVNSTNGSTGNKQLAKALLQVLGEQSNSLVGNANASIIRAKNAKNRMMASMEDNLTENGIHTISSYGSYDDYQAGRTASVTNASIASSPNYFGGRRVSKKDRRDQKRQMRQMRQQDRRSGLVASDGQVVSYDQLVGELKGELSDGEEPPSMLGGGLSNQVANKMNLFKGVLDGILSGNTESAWDSFVTGMKGSFERAGNFIANNFLKPIKDNLFGKKGENGYTEGGIFEGVNNRMRESFFSLRRMITGKGYIDADGVKIADANEEEMKNTVSGKLKSMLTSVKEGISERLFGKKNPETGEVEKEGVVKGFKNTLTSIADTFKAGARGWITALFGDKNDEDPEKTAKETVEDFKRKVTDALPNGVAGAIVGTGAAMATGGLLGAAVTGPVGALAGLTIGIASKSEKFKNWLFGVDLNDGTHVEGVIKKSTQEFVKKNKNFLAGGAALGFAKGLIFPGRGLLTGLVGGPVAGALMGLGSSILIKSEMFQRFLYGNPKSGQLGLVNTVKNMFGKFGKVNGDASGSKLLGMLGIGSIVGGITGKVLLGQGLLGLALGPAGPIGGALLGLGAGILAQKDNFKEWLFGKVDPETGVKKEGILGQFKNMLTANVFHPLKNEFKAIGRDFKTFLEYDVLNKFNLIIEPIGNALFGTLSKVTHTAMSSANDLVKYIKEDFLSGLVEGAKNILSPITFAAKTAAKGIYSLGKSMVKIPIDIMYALTSPIATSILKLTGGIVSAGAKIIDLAIVKPATNLVIKPLFGITKGLAKVISTPFKILGEAAEKFTASVTNFSHHVSNFFNQLAINAMNKVTAPFKKVGESVKEFGVHVKNAVKLAVSPITEYVKGAIDVVRDAAKKGISNFLHLLNPFTWARKIVGLFTGNKKEEKTDSGIGGYFRRIWRETATVDYSNVDANSMTNGQKRRANDLSRRNQRNADRNARIEDRARNKNEKLIAKYTNNQAVTDTEENRQLAMAMARKKGVNISNKFEKIDALKSADQVQREIVINKVEKVNTQIDEVNKNLSDIEGLLSKLGTMTYGTEQEKQQILNDQNKAFINKRRLESKKAYLERQAKQAEQEKDNLENASNTSAKDKADILSSNSGSSRLTLAGMFSKMKSNIKGENARYENVLSKDIPDDFENDEGFIEWLNENRASIPKGTLNNRRKLYNLFKKQTNKYARGTSSAKPGFAIVGEAGPEAMYSKNSKFGKLVGVGGPEVVNMKGGETVIPNSRIQRFESGTGNSDKFDHSNMSDKVLSTSKDTKKLTVSERILKGILDLKGAVLISSAISNYGGEIDESASIEDFTDYDTTNIDIIKGGLKGVGKRLLNALPGAGLVRGVAHAGRTVIGAGKEVASIAADKARNALSKVTSLTGDAKQARIAAEKEDESDDATQEKIADNLGKLNTDQKEHFSIWNSIFSKKGLITGGLLLLTPLIIKFIKGIPTFINDKLSIIKNWAGGVIDDFKFGLSRLGDGLSFLDVIGKKIDNVGKIVNDLIHLNFKDAAETFLYDENGNANHETNAKAKWLVKGGAKLAAKATGIGVKVSTALGMASGKTTLKEGAKTLGTKSSKLGSKFLTDTGTNMMKKNGAKLLGKNVVTESGGEVVEKIAKDSGDTILTKALDMVKKFVSMVTGKLGKKGAEKAGGKIVQEIAEGAAKNPTIKSKIISKVGAFLGFTAGLATTAVGLLAKDATMVVLGALNGLTGAKRLFRTDNVDALMITISSALGAFNGSTPGTVCDIINEIFASATGVDIYCELATLVYGFIAGEGKLNVLRNSQNAFQEQYDKETDESLRKQYATMIEAGLLDPSITEEEYIQGAKDGTYAGKSESFSDYNARKHKSVGAKLWDGTKNVVGGAGKFLFGKKTTSFYDSASGNTYTDNGNGTYQVTNSQGKDIGFVSKDSVDTSNMEKSSTTQGGYLVKGIKAAIDSNLKVIGGVMAAIKNPKEAIKDYLTFANGISEYVRKGDVKGLWNYEVKADLDGFGAILKPLGVVTKVLNTIPTAIAWVGHKVFDGLNNATDGKLGESITAIGNNDKQLLKYSLDGDMKGLWSTELEAPEGVFGGFVKTLGILNKVTKTPFTAISWYGHTLFNNIKKAWGVIKEIGIPIAKNEIRFAKYTMIGDVKGLWGADIDLPEGPNSGFVNVLAFLSQAIRTPFAAVVGVGRKIFDGVKTAFSAVGNIVVDVSKNDLELSKYAIKGDVKGLWGADINLPEGPSSGFVNVLTFLSQVVKTPFAALIGVGKKIFDGIKKVWEPVKNTASDIGTNYVNTLRAMPSGDVKKVWSVDIKADSPLSGYTKVLGVIGKVMATPLTALIGLGKIIFDGVKKVWEPVKNTASDISSNHTAVLNAAIAGDIGGMWNSNVRADGPLSGITKTLSILDKVMMTPFASLMWVGGKVFDAAKKVWEPVKNTATEINANHKAATDAFIAGDIGKLWSLTPTATGPLSGITKTLSILDKVTMTPFTLLSLVGHKLFDGITTMFEKVDSDTKSLDSGVDKLNKLSKDGDIKGLWNAKLNLSISNPLAPIYQAIFTISKVFNLIGSLFNGDIISRSIQDIRDIMSGEKKPSQTSILKSGALNVFGSGSGGYGDTNEMTGSTYYSQKDPRWSNKKFTRSDGVDDGSTMGNAGCGPTAMAMVVSDMNKKDPTPVEMAKLAQKTGSRDSTGTNAKFIGDAANAYGINYERTENPSGVDLVSRLTSGSPMVLLGRDNGIGTSPYTKAGHYVVANGIDSKGDVIISDPRGREYNKSVDIGTLSKSTGSAWSFFKGRKNRNKASRLKRIGGRGIYSTEQLAYYRKCWLAVVEAVKRKIAAQNPGYSNTKYISITINGKTIKVRCDCNGFVSACLKLYGVLGDNDNASCAEMAANIQDDSDDTTYGNSFDSRTNFISVMPLNASWNWNASYLVEGAIIARNGHVCIFSHNDGNAHYVYNAGSDKAINSPGITQDDATPGYTNVWVPGPPGDGYVFKGQTDMDIAASIYEQDTSSNESNDIFSKLSSVFSGIGNAVFNSLITGEDVDLDIDAILSNGGTPAAYVAQLGDINAAELNSNALAKEDLYEVGKLSQNQIYSILKNLWVGKTGSAGKSIFTNTNASKSAAGIYKAQAETNLSSMIPLAIGALESGWGTSSIAREKGNLWGWSAYNDDPFGSATTFGSNQYSAFKDYSNNLLSTYYNGYGAKTLYAIGTGSNPAHKGYAYNNDKTISTTWLPSVLACAGMMTKHLNNGEDVVTPDTSTTVNRTDGTNSSSGSNTSITNSDSTGSTVTISSSGIEHGGMESSRNFGGGFGDGITIDSQKYTNRYESSSNSAAREAIRSSISSRMGNGASNVSRLTNNYNITADNSKLERLMETVVMALDIISSNTDNLALLRDIKNNGVSSQNIIVNSSGNQSVATPNTKEAGYNTRPGTLSSNEKLARQIAFGQ